MPSILHRRVARTAARLHTLSTMCWCQPLTAFDGHRNDTEIDVDFEAISGDPIDRDGFPIEGATR
ncbi:hypothetical protein ACFORO_12700 [Amycolatopsis halotolerans]|uniref:Uncharacterized protein n=1 Tax=Amycolatopsis halotolerans TaxID=330083 RepID=A0ABV7QHN0_9PSEU